MPATVTDDLSVLSGRFAATRDDVLTLKNEVITLRAEQNRSGMALDAVAKELQKSRDPDWKLILGAIMAMLAAGGIIWSVVQSQISAQTANSIIPLQTTQATLIESQHQTAATIGQMRDALNTLDRTTAGQGSQLQTDTASGIALRTAVDATARLVADSSQADMQSRTDRTQLNDRLHTLEAGMSTGTADRRAQTAEMSARLLEIETQFKGFSMISNMTRATTQQWITVLFEQANPGRRFPVDGFAPTMFQENPAPIGITH